MKRTFISRRSPFQYAVLRMAALYCRRTPCTNRFWEHEALFSAWWCIQPPQPPRLDASNSSAYLALGCQVSLIQLALSDLLSWAQVCFLTGRLFIDIMYLNCSIRIGWRSSYRWEADLMVWALWSCKLQRRTSGKMESKVLFATTRCIWSDHLIDSLGHLMETCVSKTKNLRT